MAVPTDHCRAEGPIGEFLRSAGLENHWVTSSGYMNCISANGTYLGREPSAEILEKFRQLPEAERKPGAVVVPEISPSERLVPSPPPGGLVFKVHARFLSETDRGELRYATEEDFPLMTNPDAFRLFLEPNTEYMWLAEDEWRSLIPDNPQKGDSFPVASAVSERMARFHMNPRRAMTSENGILRKDSVREAKLTMTVDEVAPERIRLKLNGFVHTGTEFDAAQATTPNGPLGFGYAAPIHGILEYDRNADAIVRFDMVAPGNVWGRWGDANNNSLFAERPGRTPFAFAFELAEGDSPTHRLPPGGHGGRALQRGYFETGDE